jgi:sugar lactone lactonase YvrE
MVNKTKLKLVLCVGVVVLMLTACSGSTTEQPSQPPATAAPAAPAATADPGGAKWTITEGIETPESVYYDSASGSLFISQIAGMPNERDGNGRIVKATPDGKVVSTTWVTGLNAPKGMRSHDGTLWTTDIDEVIGIEISSGKITTRVKPQGAQFLNDVAVGPDGTVYVSDMMLSRIYAVKDGKSSTFADGADLEHPNGLLVQGDRLIVAAWGKPEADFTTKVPGRIFALDLKTKKKELITPNPAGNFDGLEGDGKGNYIATDYLAGKLVHVMANGDIHVLRTFMPGTADLGIAQGLAIIPHMNENKIAAYDLSQ